MITIYLSHSIRGIKGITATDEDIQQNCEKAIAFGKLLRKHFGDCVYVPAEHEDFVGRAFKNGFLIETEILDIDCLILRDRSVLAIYAPDQYISHGMMTEIRYAQANGIPIFFLFDENDIFGLEFFIRRFGK